MRTALLLLLCLLAFPAAAGAAGRAATQQELARQMAQAGAASGAYVADAASGAPLYASRASTRRMPASVQKLYTTATVLRRIAPEGSLATQTLATAPVTPDGVLAGDLYLRGMGDPTFTTIQATALARQLVANTGLSEIRGRVVGDETVFDRRRGTVASGYATSGYVGPLSGLAFNRGLTGVRAPYFQSSPGLFAAQAFQRILRREGVRVQRPARTGPTPAPATPLATWESPPVAELVARTNRPSDNYFAETLLKVLGAQANGGSGGSTARGARAVRGYAAELGLRPRVFDGSGLSRADRTSPQDVVGLLRGMQDVPAFEASFPVAGRSGTLTGRMRGTPAAGNCHAKTGTLHDVSGLAGFCTAADGETRIAFAILMNRVNPSGARVLQDRMAAALARYEP